MTSEDLRQQQITVQNAIGDIRSYVHDLHILTDKWNVRSDHKQKLKDMWNITEYLRGKLGELEKILDPEWLRRQKR